MNSYVLNQNNFETQFSNRNDHEIFFSETKQKQANTLNSEAIFVKSITWVLF